MRTSSIFDSTAQALVNPVNCVGVMGAGLALQFRQRFPGHFRAYGDLCSDGRLVPGSPVLTRAEGEPPIILFPTKNHWREQSHLCDIEAGLLFLETALPRWHILSVAIPALGCGLGGLNWSDVQPLIARLKERLKGQVDVEIWEPVS